MTPLRLRSRHIAALRSYAPGLTAGTPNVRTATLLPAVSATLRSSAAMATAGAGEPVGCSAAPTITLSSSVAAIVNAIVSVDGAGSAVDDGAAASSFVSESGRPGPPKTIVVPSTPIGELLGAVVASECTSR